MILKECYTVLGLPEDALLVDVKSAYRRLAFSLHPDLNPDVPDASSRFQELNEAYVLLSQALAAAEAGGPRQSEQTARAREDARKAYEKAQKRQGGTAESRSGPPPEKDREEILRDILQDPFARRVFEDIYSHIRHDDRPRAGGPAKDGSRTRSSPGKKGKAPGKKGGRSVFAGIRGWLRKQIDDEQILKLPGEQIVPGARVRLHIRHGLSGEPQAIELTLPPEFVPGKAMRLKGMGRRFGGWRGDLYVRIEPA